MEEDRVIEKLADWFVVVLEIEESVNERYTEHLGVEKSVDLAGTLAWHLAI